MAFDSRSVTAAVEHLQGADPALRRVIQAVGPFTLKVNRDRFGMLVQSIISQQISTAAARSIRERLLRRAAASTGGLTPEKLLFIPPEDLRAVGLSAQKTTYLLDLSARVADGQLPLQKIGRLSDEQIIAKLTEVKGIGRWTAQMFLIFALGRPDVFPHDDLGIRNALKRLYSLSELPKKAQSFELAQPWRPYATFASWYCWRSLELPDGKKSGETSMVLPVTE